MTATPNAGYSFGAWTGACSGKADPCSLTMDGAKSVSATFTQNEYALTITQASGGTISALPAGPYHLNDEVTVTATPNAGYSFGAWTGDCAGEPNPCSLTMDGAKSVSATFTQNEYALTITQASGGTISALPAGPYHLNDEVTVTATPNAGYSFGAWTGDCLGQSNPCSLTMDGAKSVSATFTQNEYALTITQASGGTISALPARTIPPERRGDRDGDAECGLQLWGLDRRLCRGTQSLPADDGWSEERIGDVHPERIRLDDHAGERRDDQRLTGGTIPPE